MSDVIAAVHALEHRGVRWSIRVTPLDEPDAAILEHNPDRVLPTASAAKILVLVAAASAMESGELDPAEPLSRSVVTPVADSGIWQSLAADTLPAADVALLVGAASDNWATNVLLMRLGGVERIRAMAAERGVSDVDLHDIVRDVRTAQDPATLSSGSARGYTDALVRLWTDSGLRPAVSARVRGWLSEGLDLSMVGGAFGLDPLSHRESDRGYRLANKTGTDLGIRVDVGVVAGPARSLAYAAIASWTDEADPSLREDVLAAMGLLGQTLRTHVD